ncbi:hypothetical protein RDM67_26165, partial [Pseudomonas aeruginosa]
HRILTRGGVFMYPRDALLNRWLFAGGDRQVRDVMVAGRWVVRDGRHAGEERSARAFVQVLGELLD